MARKPLGTEKRPPGRPATGHDPQVSVRLPQQIIDQIDKRAAALQTTRAAVVRKVVIDAFSGKRAKAEP
jgi:hypothetical protein